MEAKNKYKAEAKDLSEKYKIQYKNWKKTVSEAGYDHFVKSDGSSIKDSSKIHKREK